MNRKLKSSCTTGNITEHKAYKILHEFKTWYIGDKVAKLSAVNTLNRRRKKTINREEEIIQILLEFDGVQDQLNSEEIANTTFRLGSVGKYNMDLFETDNTDQKIKK